jgi:hypothetical protein
MSTPRRPVVEDEHDDENLDAPDRSSYRISRAAIVLIAIALGVGLLIGRASVKTDSSASAPPSKAPATKTTSIVPLGPHSLAATGAMCSIQTGDKLTLGVEVRNTSTTPIILKKLNVSLPSGGMTVLSRGVGSCGELNVPRLEDFGLAPQGAVWFSTTVRPKVRCPAPYPVLMSVAVTDPTGAKQTVDVGGFKDLGGVPWSGCTSSSASASP